MDRLYCSELNRALFSGKLFVASSCYQYMTLRCSMSWRMGSIGLYIQETAQPLQALQLFTAKLTPDGVNLPYSTPPTSEMIVPTPCSIPPSMRRGVYTWRVA